jgi:hypothetical protein
MMANTKKAWLSFHQLVPVSHRELQPNDLILRKQIAMRYGPSSEIEFFDDTLNAVDRRIREYARKGVPVGFDDLAQFAEGGIIDLSLRSSD